MRRTTFHLALCWSFAGGMLPGAAKPLDAEACARLKLQREALEQSGARMAVGQTPPLAKMRNLDDRAQQVRTLIDIDGQLRFRCNYDLPIASLRPELLVDVPDVVEGEPAAQTGAAPHKKPTGQRAKAAAPKGTSEQPSAATGAGTPVAPKQKAAGVKGAAQDGTPGVAPGKKSPVKVDDAYRAPGTGDVKAGPAEKVAPKSE